LSASCVLGDTGLFAPLRVDRYLLLDLTPSGGRRLVQLSGKGAGDRPAAPRRDHAAQAAVMHRNIDATLAVTRDDIVKR
jgi:hypothetical protein